MPVETVDTTLVLAMIILIIGLMYLMISRNIAILGFIIVIPCMILGVDLYNSLDPAGDTFLSLMFFALALFNASYGVYLFMNPGGN